MTAPSPKEALDKQIYYLESIQRQLTEYRDFVGSCEVLTPSIGGDVLADNLDWLDCHIAELKRTDGPSDGAIYAAVSKSEMSAEDNAAIEAHMTAALATLQPSGERREAIARIIEDNIEVDIDFELADFKVNGKPAADKIIASGLVQSDPTASKKEVVEGDRREAIARIINPHAEPAPGRPAGHWWREALAAADRILASGFVQDDPTTSKKEVVGGERRDAIAKELWHRFSPSHHIDWEGETHKGEYLKCADEIISLLRLGWFGSGLVQDEAGIRASGLADRLCTGKAAWPLACHSPNSCSRHDRCMYFHCIHQGEDISAAIRAARDGGAS